MYLYIYMARICDWRYLARSEHAKRLTWPIQSEYSAILTSRLVNNPFILLDFTLHHFWSSLRRISLFELDF